MRKNILVVDDERNMRSLMLDLLMGWGYGVDTAEDGERALELARASAPALMLLDLRLPGASGLEVLRTLRAEGHTYPVIMITAHGDVDTAVNALKAGAADFIVKPFENERLAAAVRQALEAEVVVAQAGWSRPADPGGTSEMVGRSPGLRDVFEVIDRVAGTDATVLIRGESGTGKELVARAVHLKSRRRDRPIIGVNCAAMPDTLLESELFGFERGAFTGAHAKKPGKMELADRGTLFLDEVGDLSAEAQAKLLRVLEDGTFTPLGGTRAVKVDLRVIAATNRELEAMMAAGSFRPDLFFRLNVVPVRLPSLRERKDDIPMLTRHFVYKLSRRHGLPAPSWSDPDLARSIPEDRWAEEPRLTVPKDLVKKLMSYDWPGNIRELEHALEKWVLLGRLPAGSPVRGPGPGKTKENWVEDVAPGPLKDRLREWERRMILEALRESGGNKAQAAKRLMVSYKTLFNRVLDLGIELKKGAK